MQQESSVTVLRDELGNLLVTLKKNRENVPLEMLRTKYKKAYGTLCADIRRVSSDYATQLILRGICVRRDHQNEVVELVNEMIQDSGISQQLSKAVFSHQDLDEFESLAKELREKIIKSVNKKPSLMVLY